MAKNIFGSREKRQKFMHGLGSFYAALGGSFGAYHTAQEAFENAQAHHLYRRVAIVKGDFCQFEAGFVKFQECRVAMQLEKKRGQELMTEALEGVDLHDKKVSMAKDVTELIAMQEGRA